jgi:branched-chain amino acid transport system ATP-binding protein
MNLSAEKLRKDRLGTAAPSLHSKARKHNLPVAKQSISGVFEASGLAKSFGGLEAVAGVDLSVARGRITGLIGPNGAGKTTLLNIMSGVESPTAGRMVFDDRDIFGLPPYHLARLGLVRTFQISRDLAKLTAGKSAVRATETNGREAARRVL